jgi:hypothetical protein
MVLPVSMSAYVSVVCPHRMGLLPCPALDRLQHEGSDAVSIFLKRLTESLDITKGNQLSARWPKGPDVGHVSSKICAPTVSKSFKPSEQYTEMS